MKNEGGNRYLKVWKKQIKMQRKLRKILEKANSKDYPDIISSYAYTVVRERMVELTGRIETEDPLYESFSEKIREGPQEYIFSKPLIDRNVNAGQPQLGELEKKL